ADAAPARPTAFLATLGPISAHAARATFTANLLAAGGIANEAAGPTATPDDVLDAFRRAPRAVACLCGTDDAYASLVEPLAAALHEAGARAVCVAGRPRNDEQEHAWRSAGVDRLLFDGCDAIEALEDLLTRSGVG
ncbi:MAG: methylmalonyl-CoA mutase, partial [Candidatus Dormiibacterota bacterium]